MGSPGIEIGDVLVQHLLKVALVDDDHLVQTLTPRRSDPALCERVRPHPRGPTDSVTWSDVAEEPCGELGRYITLARARTSVLLIHRNDAHHRRAEVSVRILNPTLRPGSDGLVVVVEMGVKPTEVDERARPGEPQLESPRLSPVAVSTREKMIEPAMPPDTPRAERRDGELVPHGDGRSSRPPALGRGCDAPADDTRRRGWHGPRRRPPSYGRDAASRAGTGPRRRPSSRGCLSRLETSSAGVAVAHGWFNRSGSEAESSLPEM
jgi:hypothetical protein